MRSFKLLDAESKNVMIIIISVSPQQIFPSAPLSAAQDSLVVCVASVLFKVCNLQVFLERTVIPLRVICVCVCVSCIFQ